MPDGKLYQGRGNLEAFLDKTNIGHPPLSVQHHKVQTEGVINTTTPGYLHQAEKFVSDAGVLLCALSLAAGDVDGDPARIGGLPTGAGITSSGALGCFGASLVLTGLRVCSGQKMSQPQLEAFDSLRLFVTTAAATAIGGPIAGAIVGVAGLLTNFLPTNCSTVPPADDGKDDGEAIELVINANVTPWDQQGPGDAGGAGGAAPVIEGKGGAHNIQEVDDRDDGSGVGDIPDGTASAQSSSSSSVQSDSSPVRDNKAGGTVTHSTAGDGTNETDSLVASDFEERI